MALDSKHPAYVAIVEDWEKMRVCYAGERAVKAAGRTYLPPTSAMWADGMEDGERGRKAYEAYKKRAVFPPYVGEAVKALIGAMHNKPPQIELPAQMEPLRERATLQGESLNLLLRRINEAQLITGRIGLLLDLPSQTDNPLPYIATYAAETILNWDDGTRENPALQSLNLVVLDESEDERLPDFEWQRVEKYRALVLGDPVANEQAGLYQQGVFRQTNTFSSEALLVPQLRGTPLQEIPFVFINASDLLTTPTYPPLLELANLCLTIYRGEADYRQNLFMQAQDTLLVIGDDIGPDGHVKQYRLGAGGCINVPLQGDARFIGVSSQGLPEQRQALENDRRNAAQMGAQLLDVTKGAGESGEALKTRVAAQTTTLNQVALAGAEGLQTILRTGARWMGLDPLSVMVKPNLEFAAQSMGAAELQALTSTELPLVEKYKVMQRKGWLPEDLDVEAMARKVEEDKTKALERMQAGRRVPDAQQAA